MIGDIIVTACLSSFATWFLLGVYKWQNAFDEGFKAGKTEPVPFTDKVTRVEVIDYELDNPRAYNRWNVGNVSVSLQDDSRTLKVFMKGKR